MATSTTTTTANPLISLRPATPSDVPEIQHIESTASQKFATIPALADLATNDAVSISHVQEWLSKGSVILACTTTPSGTNEAVGFAAFHPLDSCFYLAEISVLPEWNGRGVGGTLLDALFQHAREQGEGEAVQCSLFTYPDVPWSGPFYLKRGFREVEAESLGPEHEEMGREDGKELGREGWRRCCMVWSG